MTFITVVLCIVLLVLLITWLKFNPFLAFLIVSVTAGLLLGIPLTDVTKSVKKGIGDMLGDLFIVIGLGAMMGKLVAETGAAQRISNDLIKLFGQKNIRWALLLTGFIAGIPLFYNVGFVLLVPLVFSVYYRTKLPAVYLGLPLITALSVTHGFLPPHPAPVALVGQFKANLGQTLLYGITLAVPTVIIAGLLYSKTLKKIVAVPAAMFNINEIEAGKLPGTVNSFISALLPVFLLVLTALLPMLTIENTAIKNMVQFISDPVILMLISLLVTTFTLGIGTKKPLKEIMNTYGDAVKDVSLILLVVAGAGALKQVMVDSGISTALGNAIKTWPVHPLLSGWLIAALIRVCMGSATVAGLTAAGIIAPALPALNVNPGLMALSVGAGSLFFSHVNDAGFWMFKEYFNLSIKQTIQSWSVMETLVAVCGLIGVFILNYFV